MIIDIGPTTMLIKAKKNGLDFSLNQKYLEEEVKKILSELREVLPILKKRAYLIKNTRALPEVARRMIEAAKLVDESSLTPMACVAGAISDVLVEKIKNEWDLEFVYVNNGGDISVYAKDGSDFKTGIGDIKTSKILGYLFIISGLRNVGIATSGLGGRSFTLGLCDSVTVFAKSSAIADAAATCICNATYVNSQSVETKKAKEIDPLSDLDEEIIVKRGYLSQKERQESLQNGLNVATNLKKFNVIFDAFLYLEGSYVTTISTDAKNIKLEVKNGDKEDSNNN